MMKRKGILLYFFNLKYLDAISNFLLLAFIFKFIIQYIETDRKK